MKLCIIVPRDPRHVPTLSLVKEGWTWELGRENDCEVLPLGTATAGLGDDAQVVADLVPLFDADTYVDALRQLVNARASLDAPTAAALGGRQPPPPR